jgi:hypothetical protein
MHGEQKVKLILRRNQYTSKRFCSENLNNHLLSVAPFLIVNIRAAYLKLLSIY